MPDRRSFLKQSAAATLITGAGLAGCSSPEPRISKQNPEAAEGIPVVLATWESNKRAAEKAMNVLNEGGSALDAVEMAAHIPEADPADSSVGLGGLPDRKGFVTLDACIMGPDGNAGSVSFLQHVLHPVSVARKVMEDSPHVMLVGQGALEFAREYGFEERDLLTDNTREAYANWVKQSHKDSLQIYEGNHDTIGILAIEPGGDIAGACTTSGAGFKQHGRVGDSPIIGAGLFVDNEVGAATGTGWGELALKTLGSFVVVEMMRQGASPQEACEEAVARILSKYGNEVSDNFGMGYIALDKKGRHGAYSVGPGLSYVRYQNGKNEALQADSWRKA